MGSDLGSLMEIDDRDEPFSPSSTSYFGMGPDDDLDDPARYSSPNACPSTAARSRDFEWTGRGTSARFSLSYFRPLHCVGIRAHIVSL